jgi:FdhD protein
MRSAASKDEGAAAIPASGLAYAHGRFTRSTRPLADETAIAFSVNGSTHAVLMATPADLQDFAVGFALTERIIDQPQAIENIEIVQTPLGIDVQLRLDEAVADRLAARRRSMVGPVGCGLCGVESLEAAMRDVPQVSARASLCPAQVAEAVSELSRSQPLNDATRAMHAAGFYVPGIGLVSAREDVGRHNALDKLVGTLARTGGDAARGVIVLTSRVSVEMVQKAAVAGAGVIIAVSAPTAMAVRVADKAGITLIAIARGEEFELFTHPHRILTGTKTHAA